MTHDPEIAAIRQHYADGFGDLDTAADDVAYLLAKLAAADAVLAAIPSADRETPEQAGGLRAALDGAIVTVTAHQASPPEYPGLALVPIGDIQRLDRLAAAVRVSDHEPHDQAGEPVEGFPVCSVCGAIQTAALASPGDGE